ncbi:hypothetical protein, partial [Moorena sp. SIO3H5]|uniref:hypothetical protein n=1 Tax=Moorena sp. SIO3H5 TaxID=2607834 RepID=UPI0025DC4D0F
WVKGSREQGVGSREQKYVLSFTSIAISLVISVLVATGQLKSGGRIANGRINDSKGITLRRQNP